MNRIRGKKIGLSSAEEPGVRWGIGWGCCLWGRTDKTKMHQ